MNVKFFKIDQVDKLLNCDMVIRDIEVFEVLFEVDEVFLPDIDNVLPCEFGAYGLVRQFDSARVEQEEAVEDLLESVRVSELHLLRIYLALLLRFLD